MWWIRLVRKTRSLRLKWRRCFGFTLIELLTVSAIVAVLAGLILSALARGKEQGRTAQCAGNLRQWGLAYSMYADDNEDFLPRRGQGVQPLNNIARPTDWFNALPPYFSVATFAEMATNDTTPSAHTESVFVCPSADDPGRLYFLPYGMNMNLCPWNLATPVKLSRVVKPDCVVAMADAPGPYSSTYPSPNPYGIVARHAGRINLLFLAGEVAGFTGSRVGCGVGDPELPEVRWLTGTASDVSAWTY